MHQSNDVSVWYTPVARDEQTLRYTGYVRLKTLVSMFLDHSDRNKSKLFRKMLESAIPTIEICAPVMGACRYRGLSTTVREWLLMPRT